MDSLEHPAAIYEPGMATMRMRAKLTIALLAITAVARASSVPVRAWQGTLVDRLRSSEPPSQVLLALSDRVVQSIAIWDLVLLVLTALAFLSWLHRTASLTAALGGDAFSWTPKQTVESFIVPFVNVVRPFRVMRDINDTLTPETVPEPPVKVRADDTTGYRSVKVESPPAATHVPPAFIGAWWTCFWIGGVLANFAWRSHGTSPDDFQVRNGLYMASEAFDVASAVLAVLMVRSLRARLDERFRRVRHNSVEDLRNAGIVVS